MPRAWFVAFAALLSFPAFAANSTVTLQNDGFVSGAVGASAIDVVTGEGWGATFKVEPSQTPIRLKKLQGLFAGNPAFAGTECAAFSVKVFEDTGIEAPLPDGPAVFDSMTAGEYTFDIPANDSALQEIDFGTFSPIWIDTPGFRVEIHAESNMCLMMGTGNNHYPVLAVDADGVSTPGVNTLYAFDMANSEYTWFEAGALGISGDYILRAVVETTGCTPNCTGKQCGSDGCQGSCGVCGGLSECVAGQCCTPDCQGKQCGTDGCGGSCGSCGADAVCKPNGACEILEPDVTEPDQPEPDVTEPDQPEPDVAEPDQPEPDVAEPAAEVLDPDVAAPDVPADDTAEPETSAAFRVDDVVPAEGSNDRETDVLILGAGFTLGATVRLDADHLIVKNVTPTSIEATVPIGLAPGVKTLVVQLPAGDLATLAQAFTVLDGSTVETSGGGSGCEVGARSLPAVPALLALALALVLLRRRVPREG